MRWEIGNGDWECERKLRLIYISRRMDEIHFPTTYNYDDFISTRPDIIRHIVVKVGREETLSKVTHPGISV